MGLRTPLAKARGLGSAKVGLHHWWIQRVTAVALIPLSLWLVFSVVLIPKVGYETVVNWVASPWNAVLLLSFIVASFHHSILGIQVVIEDYIHTEWLKVASLLSVKLILIFLALAALFATVRIAFVG